MKTTRDGRMKRESTQSSTRISEISSPSIFLTQRRNTKLTLNFVTWFTLIDDKKRNLPGRREAVAIKQISIFPRIFSVFKQIGVLETIIAAEVPPSPSRYLCSTPNCQKDRKCQKRSSCFDSREDRMQMRPLSHINI